MKVSQIAQLLNEVNAEVIGESAIVAEDLSNVVDVGRTILNSTDVDNYVHKLLDRIGRVVFVDRVYTSQAPALLRDSWEYGSVMEKVRCSLPEMVENPSWKLEKGVSYDPYVYSPPDISVKLYNSKTTYEIDISILTKQVKSALGSPAELNRLISMIENRIRMAITLNTDNMIMRTINNMIAEKIAVNNNVVNLLTAYNTEHGTTLTAEQAMRDKEFLRYCALQIMQYEKYISGASMLFNNDGYVTFTPKDRLKLVLLDKFARASEVYMQSDTYHDELVKLNGYSTVPYWQGSGVSDTFPFETISSINVKTASGKDVSQSGIVGVMFDFDAMGVTNEDYRITSEYSSKGEFWNYFYKYDCSYFNDLAENCIVFVVANPA